MPEYVRIYRRGLKDWREPELDDSDRTGCYISVEAAAHPKYLWRVEVKHLKRGSPRGYDAWIAHREIITYRPRLLLAVGFFVGVVSTLAVIGAALFAVGWRSL